MCQDILCWRSRIIVILDVPTVMVMTTMVIVRAEDRADERPATRQAPAVAEEHFQRDRNPLLLYQVRAYISNENL